jgi:hypothetical protein
MEWKDYQGKSVYIKTNSNLHYQGKVINVEVFEKPKLIWITILDKFNHEVTFVHSEIAIIEIQGECKT